jgi:hypothetical protein
MPNRMQLLEWLSECRGDEIWSLDYCRQRCVPNQWIDSLMDAYESGFRSDRETIYYRGALVAQFEGVRDVDLALQIANELGLDVDSIQQSAWSPTDCVQKIHEAVLE